MIRLGYVECNDVLKLQNREYFTRAACTIVAGEVIVRTPWVLRLIEDYIVKDEEEFEENADNPKQTIEKHSKEDKT